MGSQSSSKQLCTFHVPTVIFITLYIVGVADGGAESAFFSKALMECCSNVVMEGKVDLSCTTKILSQGFEDLMLFHSYSYGRLGQ